MNVIFSKYADYYDALYQDKNYGEESKYIEKVINKFAGKRLNILELGCGSGSHAIYLKKKIIKLLRLIEVKK